MSAHETFTVRIPADLAKKLRENCGAGQITKFIIEAIRCSLDPTEGDDGIRNELPNGLKSVNANKLTKAPWEAAVQTELNEPTPHRETFVPLVVSRLKGK